MKGDRRLVGGEADMRRIAVKEVRRWSGIQEGARGQEEVGSGLGVQEARKWTVDS